jgi:hypothetical protein
VPQRPTYVRRIYRDGPEGATPWLASHANHEGEFLQGLDVDVADLEDRVGDLESAGGGDVDSTALQYVQGTTAERANVSPAVGTVFLNRTTFKPEFGWGDSWRLADGQLINSSGGGGGTPGPGASNAPQNFTAVVQPNGDILTAWDAVTGATAYTVRENRSPNGVSGMPITGTSSLRTGLAASGDYTYWVTCTVGGVESAASNKVTVSKPYGSTPTPGGGSTGGGTGSTTPAGILRLGDEGGYWSIDVAYPSGNKSIELAQLVDGFQQVPYFTPVENNTGVQFRTPMNGGTTPNSEYPRVELRERNPDGTRAAWSASQVIRSVSAVDKITHFPPNKPEMVIGQIHDGSDDLLQIRVEGTTWRLSLFGDEQDTPLLTGYTLGTYVAWAITVNKGLVAVKINGVEKWSGRPAFGSTCYFKTGCYAQTNTAKGNAASEYVDLVRQKDSLVHIRG